MWLFMGLLGCTDKPSTPLERIDTAESTGFVPSIPTSSCGEVEYNWLSTTEMGSLIEIEDIDELSLTKDTINLLLEQLGVGGLAPVSYDVKTYRIRYQTQNRGNLIEATGIITLPIGKTSPAEPMLWTHPTTGFSDACAPSGQGLEGAAFPILWAALGYAVAAPDYIGMAGWGEPSNRLHPYIVAEATAIASLDSLRAMDKLIESRAPELTLDRTQTVFWGVSEGGYAALVSDRYRPHYLPEFEGAATVSTIPATNLLSLATLSMAELHESTFGLLAVISTHAQWYGDTVSVNDVIQPDYNVDIEAALQQCEDFGAADGITSVEQIYQNSFIEAALAEDWDAIEPWSCYFEENSITHTAIPIISPSPTLIITAEDDDLALPGPVKADIITLCDAGYTIEHIECADANHVEGARDTLEAQLDWISARLDGLSLNNTCEIQAPTICE